MEIKKKENTRFCCELVRSSSFATKSILIFILSLCMFFITCTNVKATQFEFNNNITQAMIDYYKQNNSNQYLINGLNNINITELTNLINQNLLNIEIEITEENIMTNLEYINNYNSSLSILISRNNSNNINLGQLNYTVYQESNGKYSFFANKRIVNSSEEKDYYITIKINTYNNPGTIELKNQGQITISGTSKQIATNKDTQNFTEIENQILSFKQGNFIYNGATTHIIANIINYNFNQQQMENTDQSEYGYLWSPASSGEARVNLLYDGNSNIDCDYYIGNELTHTYNFYYYSGDTKVSVNDYISIYTTQTTSGEWYKHYITNAGKEHLTNNTHYLIDVYANLGNQTVTVVENFNAFYTVEEVIPTPTPIPTATPTPTPVPDIETISGQINDINNNISNSTQTIINQISGDNEKIINNLENISAPYSGEIQNDLPSSGDILEKTGYHKRNNPYESFWTAFISGLNENLLNDENISIQFPDMTGTTRTINSADFIIPENPIKTFTNVVMTSLLVFQMLKFIREIINGLNQGEIHVLHDVDADVYFF